MHPYEFVCQVLVPTRAYENQVFLAYANFQGSEGELEYCGLSCVVAPDGQVMARAKQAGELLIADLEPERIAMVREGYSYLRLRRPMLYRS
jgi:predicted amidohydrolase